MPAMEKVEEGRLTGVPVAIAAADLKPGKVFSKKKGSNECYVDGKRFVLFHEYTAGDILRDVISLRF